MWLQITASGRVMLVCDNVIRLIPIGETGNIPIDEVIDRIVQRAVASGIQVWDYRPGYVT